MSPEEREAVTRSIANLWTFNALFISHLLRSARDEGWSPERIELLLQDADDGVVALEGEDDQVHATRLLATVRALLRA